MKNRYAPDDLMRMRNHIDIAYLIADVLALPWKRSEGYFRFLCPDCAEFNTATNAKTNLARCFRCERNFNPIDMVMVVKHCSFLDAADFLSQIM
ncbi:MAG: CHC2 zinc finger domain-containing protein [Chloroflexi bacterium]|jgi:hypothetical protein|nr:CHC2 zinc finger domain-containing protein [Chloroflexota bacterium]